jgi:selenocysteine lyase/cysteine desulfurase
MNTLGLDGTVRLSAHVYNTEEEIDQAAGAVADAVEALAR